MLRKNREVFDKKSVVNLSGKELDCGALEVLRKGLSFVPTPTRMDSIQTEVLKSVKEYDRFVQRKLHVNPRSRE